MLGVMRPSTLRGLEVDNELELRWLLNRKVGNFRSLQYPVNVDGGISVSSGPPYGVGTIVDALYEVGISGQDTIVGINQGWKLSGAIKTAERKLADRTLLHGGQALMAWAVSNARVEPKGNAIVITKQASGTAKIDPQAVFNVAAEMSRNRSARRKEFLSSYARPGRKWGVTKAGGRQESPGC